MFIEILLKFLKHSNKNRNFIEILFERLDSSIRERSMLFTKLAQLRIELFKNRLNILKLNELISNFKLEVNFQ